MGRHPLGSLRRIDRRALHRTVQELMDRLGVKLDPEQPVRGLSIADQQIVEIAKALSFDARVLIMDEPTAALSGHEVERLFGVVRTLRERGAAVLFISPPPRRDLRHLRHGHRPARRRGHARRHDRGHGPPTSSCAGWSAASSPRCSRSSRRRSARRCSRSTRLTREGVFIDVSFEVRRGEIVALAGLVGAGRSEVARAIFGVDTPDAGHVTVDGVKLKPGSPERGDEGRHRPRARGPPPAGPGDGARASSATSASRACRRCATGSA